MDENFWATSPSYPPHIPDDYKITIDKNSNVRAYVRIDGKTKRVSLHHRPHFITYVIDTLNANGYTVAITAHGLKAWEEIAD